MDWPILGFEKEVVIYSSSSMHWISNQIQIMKSTTEQWTRYHEDLSSFKERMEMVKPVRENFETELDFDVAMCEWFRSLDLDAPTKPGADYANNH